MIKQLPLCFFFVFLFWACSHDDEQSIAMPQTSPVVYEIDQEPFENLSDYNFFEGELKDLNPVYGVIPYEPINSLFTDYAHKKRFVWMPQNTKALYVDDSSVLNFPVGTILIKSFYYDNVQPSNTAQIIETRLMLNTSNGWQFANYVWNEEQTDALLDMEGSYKLMEWIENGVLKTTNYRIPSASECFTCHKAALVSSPIGPKPQNINKNLLYSDGVKNQLQKLIEVGYLENTIPSTINTVVRWDDESQPLDLRMRSYVDINCAHCHFDDGHCNYRPMRFPFYQSEDFTNLGVCVEPEELFDGLNYIVSPGNVNRSMLYFRISTTLAQRRMPLLGRSIVHEEAIEMVEEWINSLTETCE